uniref:CSON003127 protein n=1 Tax=Culicoides sonorensis TaxID=179676 RepID=A0A336LW51_CULSO
MLFHQIIVLAIGLPCFVRSYEITLLVGGGDNVKIKDYPFIVICYKKGYFTCGGSILNEYWVLTAGHCTCHKIQWGVTNRDPNGPNMIDVSQSVRHPDYESHERVDIKLLRLAEPIVFGTTAQAIKLPKFKWEVKGDSYKTPSAVLGWGRDETGAKSKSLKIGNFFVINNTDCKRMYGNSSKIYDFNCCNGCLNCGVSACKGDSGGPIITWINGKRVQYGIVSRGKRCGDPKFPSIGIKTSHFVDWISQITGIPLEQLTV